MSRHRYWVIVFFVRMASDVPLLGMIYFLHTSAAGEGGLRHLKRKLMNKPTRPPVFSFRGPYAYVRQPMYLALIGVLWIGPVMTFTRLEFASLATVYLLVGTFFEEHNLRDELGPIYDTYRRFVPMWIPRSTPWRPGAKE